MSQTDLFSEPLIAGLAYRRDFITQAEHDCLVTELGKLDLAPFRFHGWLGNRKTRTFGWRYDFDDASFSPAEPMPRLASPASRPGRPRWRAWDRRTSPTCSWLATIRAPASAGIAIAPQFDEVVGISLGSPATMRFRQRTAEGFRRANVQLEPRSAYLLSGEVRWEWEHSIVPGDSLRFSITFRSLSEKGRRLAERFEGTVP